MGSLDGQLFITNIGAPVNADIEDNPAGQINRDGDIDAGVVVHEYGHGVSNRLTGGPATASCLATRSRWARAGATGRRLHAAVGDTATTPRPIGLAAVRRTGRPA